MLNAKRVSAKSSPTKIKMIIWLSRVRFIDKSAKGSK